MIVNLKGVQAHIADEKATALLISQIVQLLSMKPLGKLQIERVADSVANRQKGIDGNTYV